ncbi:sigma factor-like helix-turn-helix DNA-binding protein [Herpetosiphon llansteffanensis]|uniref:sigma factor-like helix-turn-helix DNA-binding protein n=1 Tax=Herpetosiphon llansteffanensis TaxID=2094568 RepID=UPI000D7C4A7C
MTITIPDQLHSITIQQLQLPNRTKHALLRANIWNLGDLNPFLEDLLSISGIGVSSIPIIVDTLKNLIKSMTDKNTINWEDYWKLQNVDPVIVKEDIILSDKSPIPEIILDVSIYNLHLSKKTYDFLVNTNISLISDLYSDKNKNIIYIKNSNRSIIEEVENSLSNLINSIDNKNQIDWNIYYKKQNIIIIPQKYNVKEFDLKVLEFIEETVQFILSDFNDERYWRIIQRRFGLGKTSKLTLEELGSVFGITRERVRQIELKCLRKLRISLIKNEYIQSSYIIHQNIISTIKSIISIFDIQDNKILLESDLFNKIKSILPYVNVNHPVIYLLLNLAEMNPIYFIDDDLLSVWQHISMDMQDVIQKVVTSLDTLLTKEVAVAMDEFDILLKINQKLPKSKKLNLPQLHQFIKLCSTIEQRDDGLFWGKFEYLKSRGNQAYRLLNEANKPLSFVSMTRTINSTLIAHGHKKLQEQNFVNQLVNDARFMPIGKTGQWALKEWNHIDTTSILELMEKFLHTHNKPATDQEIFDYVQQRRPASRGSIDIYLANNPHIFRKTNLNYWGLTTWKETENAHIWDREGIADFIAGVFKQHKTHNLELRIIREALMNAAGITSRQARGLLLGNPALRTYQRPKTTTRFAMFQPNYKAEINTKRSINRKKKTIRENVQQAVHALLEQSLNKQMPLFQLIKQLTSAPYNFHDKTMYLYIRQMASVETISIPETGTKVCRLKDTNSITFSQINRIQDSQLRDNINHALINLNEANVDIALFQLGREFEVVIKNCLIKGHSNGKLNLSQNLGKDSKKWKLVEMVDYAKNQNLITDLGAVNLLRQERNNNAHGSRPTLSERQALMNSAPYLAGLYIDYIIHFSELMDTF